MITIVDNVTNVGDTDVKHVIAPVRFEGSTKMMPAPDPQYMHSDARPCQLGHMHQVKRDSESVDYGILIGQGSFGLVVVGKEIGSNAPVAVKITKKQYEMSCVKDGLGEVMMIRKLGGHPNIVDLYGCYYDKSDRRIYVVMELMQGDLKALVKSKKDSKLSEPRHHCCDQPTIGCADAERAHNVGSTPIALSGLSTGGTLIWQLLHVQLCENLLLDGSFDEGSVLLGRKRLHCSPSYCRRRPAAGRCATDRWSFGLLSWRP